MDSSVNIIKESDILYAYHLNPLANNKWQNNNSGSGMNEYGKTISILIRKRCDSLLPYPKTRTASASSYTSWRFIGDAPIVTRISSLLTVDGFRKLLGCILSHAFKLQTRSHSNDIIMAQVALSCESLSSYGNGDEFQFGSVTIHQWKESIKPIFANSNDDKEKELVANIVNDKGSIVVSWPTHLADVLDENALGCSAVLV